VRPPHGLGGYAFAVLSSLRAGQLIRGCTPKIDAGVHKPIVVAQLEVARGAVAAVDPGERPGD
jgi:DNA-directed RNA polymerase subunit K/omega